jgi:hypothetical protein
MYHAKLIAERPVLAQIELSRDPAECHTEAHNGFQETGFEPGR